MTTDTKSTVFDNNYLYSSRASLQQEPIFMGKL